MYDIEEHHVEGEDSWSKVEFDFVTNSRQTQNQAAHQKADDIDRHAPLNIFKVIHFRDLHSTKLCDASVIMVPALRSHGMRV